MVGEKSAIYRECVVTTLWSGNVVMLLLSILMGVVSSLPTLLPSQSDLPAASWPTKQLLMLQVMA